ncbi:hypothetical protein [Brevundimonas sp.]|uniref:hypothetical protein n=1 Tax=Brevundimonas sp. TaxID=1871086 RepID=UPI003D6C73C1
MHLPHHHYAKTAYAVSERGVLTLAPRGYGGFAEIEVAELYDGGLFASAEFEDICTPYRFEGEGVEIEPGRCLTARAQ